MNVRKPTRQTAISVSVLAVCALVWTAMANVKNPVPRPFQTKGTVTINIKTFGSPVPDPDLDALQTGSWTTTATPVATHLGRYTEEGEGGIYIDYDFANHIALSPPYAKGHGRATAVGGDTIEWDSFEWMGSQHVTITFTGGTGRFEYVSGGFSYDHPAQDPTATEWIYEYIGAGTITY
jgi:hypothetical protein